MQKKQYENVFAKMIEYHNNKISPLLKKMRGRVKISARRILSMRDTFENSKDILISRDTINNYIITNSFLLELIDEKEINNCIELVNSSNRENIFIGANCIYSLIEETKEKIRHSMKNDALD